MNKREAQDRASALRAEIERHNRLYYIEAAPEIGDREYDALMDELGRLESEFPDIATPESPSRRVGGAPIAGFVSVRHAVPMLSLDKLDASDKPDEKEEPDRRSRLRRQDENTIDELGRFDEAVKKAVGAESIKYVLEPKVDGVSISVHYRDGLLVLGTTRGDGYVGDDITANVRTIRNIPLRLNLKNPPAYLEVRGEAYMPTKAFEEFNLRMVDAGERPFPNARNATAGSLKQLDSKVAAERPVRAVFYAVGRMEGVEFDTHAETLEALKRLGLPVQNEWWVCDGIGDVVSRYRDSVVCGYDDARDLRARLPYDIDGVVIKVDHRSLWSRIPDKAKAPGYAIVHKPIPWISGEETVLEGITVQVGRTGVLTPVAELRPVFIQGSTVSRATLHNEDEIKRKDIRIGDTVIVRKAGMVIPEVVEVVKGKRSGDAKVFDLVEHVANKCPACSGTISKQLDSGGKKTEVAWRCDNIAGCPAQRVRRVEFLAQRGALDIEGLGGVVAQKVVESGLVKEPLDLFELKTRQLASLNLGTEEEPRVLGEKNAERIVDALERARTMPLSRWLFALGIPDVGVVTARQIAVIHGSIAEVASSQPLKDRIDLEEKQKTRELINPRSRKNRPATDQERESRQLEYELLTRQIEELERRLEKYQLSEVGPVVARRVLMFFSSDAGQAVLKRLDRLGISPRAEHALEGGATGVSLKGKTFVLTGDLTAMKRMEAEERIRALGGTASSSVSGKTSFLVVGANPGKTKTEEAKRHNVPTINEQEFLDMLGAHAIKPKPKRRIEQGDLFA